MKPYFDTELLTRRHYLRIMAMVGGAPPFLIEDTITSIALEHPELDMNETKTFTEWAAGE